uniref:WD repeat-containing protein 89 n=1 Tax=Sipha flava TaxID=143950 RepID=A0A2S2RB18_9HEMI
MTLNFITDGETLNSSSDSDSTNQSLINEENVSDGSEDDINSYPFVFDESKEIHYKIKYKQIFEEDININEVYILNLDAQKLGQSLRVATAHTDHTCRVYGIEAGSKSFTECLDHEDQIIDVKFGSKDSQISSIVFTGSDNGTIKLWDLRLKEKCISVFKDETDGSPKPITCFDVSCDGRFIVAGTEVLKDDSFLLFWDIRTTNLLGGYWDTHYGDITQVNIFYFE